MSLPYSKEEKIRLYEIIQEKKRRIMAKKPTYRPNAGQLPVHTDTHVIRIVAAGNGGGKTALGTNEALWWATGYNPITKLMSKVPAKIIILLDSPMKVAEVWEPEIRKWYPTETECEFLKNGKPYVNEIRFKNGSKFMFMFHEQEDMVFEGIEFDYLLADEPFPRRIWISLSRGARKKHSKPRFLILGTPIGQPWLYEDLWKKAAEGEREDVGLHRFDTEVNRGNLADGYIEQFTKNLTDAEKKVRLSGHFAHLEGLALAHLFHRDRHIVPRFPWPQGKPCVLIIDPHWAKPHTVAIVGATGDGRIYYIKEMKSKSPAIEFAKELKEFSQGFRIIDHVIDSLGETPRTGGTGNLSFSQVLRDNGIPVRSTSFADKDDEDFIQCIHQVLETPDKPDNFGRCQPKLAIMSGNHGIVNDIESVQWMKNRNQEQYKNKLDITRKDYLSLLKYALATSIAFVADVGRVPKAKRSGRSPWGGVQRRA